MTIALSQPGMDLIFSIQPSASAFAEYGPILTL